MHYKDISKDSQEIYRIIKPGVFVFFLRNRSDDITFLLESPGAKVLIFGIFEGKNEEKFSLVTTQKHLAPDTKSSLLIKSVLRNTSQLNYSGTILIEKQAQRSNASLENRNLLVGDHSSAETKPFLEILANDVQCHHSATTAPINPDHIAYLCSRGISATNAEQLLIEGFLKDIEEKIKNTR